jgi:lipopolysaccharide export system permease protein
MMNTLDRYVGKNVLVTMLIGIVVLSLVLVFGNILKELLDRLINQNVPLGMVLMFMAFVLPFSLTFSIPWGLLTALLLVFGRMSADNELIALRSNGVSIPRICIPVFALAIALTGVCFWINAEIAPRAEQKMTDAIFDIATNNPILLFQPDEVVDQFPDRRVYVGGKDGNTLKNLIVFEINDEWSPTRVVYAREGVLTPDPKNSQLLLKVTDARFEQRDRDEPRDIYKIQQGIVLQEGTLKISLAALYEENERGRRLSSYTLPELEKFIAAGAGGKPLPAKVELHKRLSASLACIAFALVAVPMGITTHRKETSVGFAISLVIAFTYFFFIILADTFRENAAAHPTLLIWIPNVIFITLGSILFHRLSRR